MISTSSKPRSAAKRAQSAPRLAQELALHLASPSKPTIEDVRDGAKVSPNLLVDLVKMHKHPGEAQPEWAARLLAGGDDEGLKRLRAGRSESLAKLFSYLRDEAEKSNRDFDLDIDTALSEFGLSPTEADQGDPVALGISRAGPATETFVPPTRDRITSSVLQRRPGNPLPLRVKVFKWPPFEDDRPEFTPGGRTIGNRLSRAWFGGIDPIDFKLETGTVSGFAEAIRALIGEKVVAGSRPPPPEAEVVLGLYENTYRKIRGAEFVSLPGIANALGAMTTLAGWTKLTALLRDIENQSGGKPRTLWEVLLNHNQTLLRSYGFNLITVAEEVGDLFCQGPCGIEALSDGYQRVKYEDTAKAWKASLQQAPQRFPLLIADRIYCFDLRSLLTGKEGISQADLVTLISQAEDETWFRELDKDGRKFIQDTNVDAPKFRVGAAFSRTEPRFVEYAREALYSDLLYNSTALAGALYAEMLVASPEMLFVPFEQEMSAQHRKRLTECTTRSLKAIENKYPNSPLSTIATKRLTQIEEWNK